MSVLFMFEYDVLQHCGTKAHRHINVIPRVRPSVYDSDLKNLCCCEDIQQAVPGSVFSRFFVFVFVFCLKLLG